MIRTIYKNISKEQRAAAKELLESLPKEGDHEDLCKKFNTWLHVSKPGDKLCYFYGPYVAGKSVARAAFKAYEEGIVDLFQRKGDFGFHYFAQKRKRWED